jgi:hypothetical protein
MNLHTPNFDPFLSENESKTRGEARNEVPSWLVDKLDVVDLASNEALQTSTSAYFNRFSETIQARVRKEETFEVHNNLPHGLATELATPLPAIIPNGASTYFRTLLDNIRLQIESLEETYLPEWLAEVLEMLHEPSSEEMNEQYAAQLLAQIKVRIHQYEDVPEWLQEALSMRDNQIPEGEDNYFRELPTRIEALMSEQEANHPWLDNALQLAASPPIPEGKQVYFSSFAGQVRATIAEMDALEREEIHEPTTVERLVDSPDRFHQMLEEMEHLELPVGQELYFDDFSDRVKGRIKERGLIKLPKNPVILFMLRPPIQWAAAACFGFLLGFIWFQPQKLQPLPTTKVQQETERPNMPAPNDNRAPILSPIIKPENQKLNNQP